MPENTTAREQPDDPEHSLTGTWRVIGIEAAGERIPPVHVQAINLRYTFTDNKITISRPDRPEQIGVFEVDFAGPLGWLTLKHQQPPVHAICKVAGDTLQICVMVDEARFLEFPTDFVSQPFPKTDVLTLQRESNRVRPVPSSPDRPCH
jgi:uncharacterized protein (TIGR03067 family)